MVVPSIHPGMGARPLADATSFRVWAPHADGVSVAGDFNDWKETDHPLAREPHGMWSADIPDATSGDEYKFVVFRAGQIVWRNDPYARQLRHSNGNSIVTDLAFDWGPPTRFRMPDWNELVIYELHIGTFNDAPEGPPGMFHNVISKLPYLRDLGINCIEVMPAAEFPLGHGLGYNPAHIFAVEYEYGGPNAFREFIRAAHDQGIAVILDVVYNHLGPADLDLIRFDGWWQPSHPDGIYFYDQERIVTPWGGPRPDYGREEVRQFLVDNALYWLHEFRLDGLRLDATSYVRRVYGEAWDLEDGWHLLRRINNTVNAQQPWKFLVAEDMRDEEVVTRPTSDGGLGFDSQWDAGFVHPIRRNLVAGDDAHRNLAEIRQAIEHRYNGDAFRRVIYTESHDEVGHPKDKRRLPEEIWRGNADSWYSKKRSTLGAAIVMTAPGIPLLFQGQEFLEDGWFSPHEPLDWPRQSQFVGIFHLYRDLIRLRRNWFNHTRGLRGQHLNVFHRNDHDKVLAYHRWDQGGAGDDVVVVLNFGNRSYASYHLGFPRGGRWHVRFNSDWRGYDPSFGNWHSYDTEASPGSADAMPYAANVGLGPYTAILLSQ